MKKVLGNSAVLGMKANLVENQVVVEGNQAAHAFPAKLGNSRVLVSAAVHASPRLPPAGVCMHIIIICILY